MILRDIPLKPRNADSEYDHWVCTTITVNPGFFIYIERAHNADNPWCVYACMEPKGSFSQRITDDRISHMWLGEFEAQAVLDHYLQQGTIKP
jgi:hypothetical protein